ncbi:HRDC domain-containing protein [Ornithinimicrobium sp. F0845]|uniref:HRDC domain-containing protein n=1 Tax=Ornithinimicrobium sp. F0845 TaxID=2926412 RepID=UPI001FF602A6|nr:HRDC domain-containing protein [Ornithinimicrobium sp. F0845]MCK0111860.1 HRDC domain-containing protein [Ornithinimicrobium sp. F0845]
MTSSQHPHGDHPEPTAAPDAAPGEQETTEPIKPLEVPADGVPTVTDGSAELDEVVSALAAGTGPVAVDAERASGYRYGQRAYLVQLRREGAGSFLIDPIALPDLSTVNDALGDTEWVLHAATQDIPCLAEVGMRPSTLFDTELGARLAGRPKVGLAAVLEHYLGVSLAKEHSAVDWSTRPLPEPWLLYATLDVELLVELRDAVEADLLAQGKGEWAAQEFAAEVAFTGNAPRQDPWRRTSGMHKVRNRRIAAHVQALWEARDRIARQRDVAPGRVLPDATLIDLAVRQPHTPAALSSQRSVEAGRSRQRRATQGLARYQRQWLEAIRHAGTLPEDDLPELARRSDVPPPARAWADRDPVAAARLAAAREQMAELSEHVTVPVENLLTPETLRRVLWTPPEQLDPQGVDAALEGYGARPWQRELVTPLIVKALQATPDEG